MPGVVTIHDLAVLHHPETLTWRVRLSLLPFLERTVRQATRILTVSHSVAGEIAQQWPDAARAHDVAWNGVAAEFRPASGPELAAIRDAPRAAADRFIFFAGTVEPRKNLDLLLDAWEALRRESAETPPLLVAGPDGWGSRATHRRMERLAPRGLRRLGHLERADLIAVLQAATVFVFPSLYEGFGLPAAEAMACGVPVMVSNRSSLPEVVGDAGRLFDPDDPVELAAACCASGSTRRSCSRAARARGLERAAAFTWKRSAEVHAAVFRQALGAAAGGGVGWRVTALPQPPPADDRDRRPQARRLRHRHLPARAPGALGPTRHRVALSPARAARAARELVARPARELHLDRRGARPATRVREQWSIGQHLAGTGPTSSTVRTTSCRCAPRRGSW